MKTQQQSRDKTIEMLLSRIDNLGLITEKEINLIKRGLNNKKINRLELLTFPTESLRLTPEQINKGLTWLKDKAYTPTGHIRVNNPLLPVE